MIITGFCGVVVLYMGERHAQGCLRRVAAGCTATSEHTEGDAWEEMRNTYLEQGCDGKDRFVKRWEVGFGSVRGEVASERWS